MIEEHRPLPDDFFRDWKEREALAEGMIPLIGALYREKNVSTYMYGSNMVNMSVIDLMKAHRFVRQVESNELSEFETYPMLEAMSKLQIGPAHIDIGKMVVSYQELSGQKTIEEFLDIVLAEIIGSVESVYPICCCKSEYSAVRLINSFSFSRSVDVFN